jgi:hypothetical protein
MNASVLRPLRRNVTTVLRVTDFSIQQGWRRGYPTTSDKEFFASSPKIVGKKNAIFLLKALQGKAFMISKFQGNMA